MKHKLKLPIVEPIYSTYHYQGPATAMIATNPSIRNYYLNQVLVLDCNRKFQWGFTTPELGITDSSWRLCPYLERKQYPMEHLRGYIHPLIRNLLSDGYYAFFEYVDDYYVKGKSWYGERHFPHDGCICGYDQEKKTYHVYAYDNNWIYRTFETEQGNITKGMYSCFKQNLFGTIYGIRPTMEIVKFSPVTALNKMKEHLDSSFEKYPPEEDGTVYGIVVHDYLMMYLNRLFEGAIPFERMDGRIFRLLWEHKKVMHERIFRMEDELGWDHNISEAYYSLVNESNKMRMLYAAHKQRRRDAVLPFLAEKTRYLKETEERLLSEMINNAEKGGIL